ncbi:PUA-like domain-containing protein, partial [Coprinopsis sp. MPI-PUGE-AT-0042]
PNGKFGEVKGYPVGSKFKDRKACFEAGVHGKTRAGIHGSRRLGAYSICLSGNYEDDEDDGDFIVYTGTGGQRDSNTEVSTGSQITDQSFDHNDNAALKLNAQNGRPVRVIRKHCDDSPHAPQSGYRYDGLYKVERAYLAKGKHGFDVCRYQLRVSSSFEHGVEVTHFSVSGYLGRFLSLLGQEKRSEATKLYDFSCMSYCILPRTSWLSK